jgi:Ca-activated chloride channel family protein
VFYRFADAWILLFLLMLPVIVYLNWKLSRKRKSTLVFSNLALIRQAANRKSDWTRVLLTSLRILALAAGILALARPQSGVQGEEVKTEGIDIVLAMDVSSSMLAEDIEPNRIAAAKTVASDFVRGRRNDRIGLVIFSGRSYTQCPLTTDYGIITALLEELEVGMIEDGTAIGTGLGVAVNRLRDSEAKSKVIILLTDGRNNRGEIDPKTAAELASTFGIKVYTIGAGKKGLARYPVDDPVFGRRYVQIQVDIDEDTLKAIAEIAEGQYFRATDRASLEEIYHEIDQLEKTEIEITEFTRYSELFHFPLGIAVLLLMIELMLRNTRFRKLP